MERDGSLGPSTIALLSLLFCGGNVVLAAIYRQLHFFTAAASPAYLAFETLSGCACTALAYLGVLATLELHHSPPETAFERLYDNRPTAQLLCSLMLSYQIFDFLAGLFIANLQKAELFMHHIMAGSLALAALHPYGHAYAPFFFGIVEISSVFLTAVEVMELFPAFVARHKMLFITVQGCFAVSFILIRLVAWPYYLAWFWPDNIAIVQSGQAHSLFVVGLYFVSCAGLTFLQAKWGLQIFKAIFALFAPAESSVRPARTSEPAPPAPSPRAHKVHKVT